MANYAYVENNQIVGVYDLLPTNWRNYSNFFALKDDSEFLQTLGWYSLVNVVPDYDPSTQKLDNQHHWFADGVAYQTSDVIDLPLPDPIYSENNPGFTEDQIILDRWNLIRSQRDDMMKSFEWRYTRYDRQTRMGISPTDDIVRLDTYMQALADITSQTDPFNIIWPVFEEVIVQ